MEMVQQRADDVQFAWIPIYFWSAMQVCLIAREVAIIFTKQWAESFGYWPAENGPQVEYYKVETGEETVEVWLEHPIGGLDEQQVGPYPVLACYTCGETVCWYEFRAPRGHRDLRPAVIRRPDAPDGLCGFIANASSSTQVRLTINPDRWGDLSS